jgi:hypothetical protein
VDQLHVFEPELLEQLVELGERFGYHVGVAVVVL